MARRPRSRLQSQTMGERVSSVETAFEVFVSAMPGQLEAMADKMALRFAEKFNEYVEKRDHEGLALRVQTLNDQISSLSEQISNMQGASSVKAAVSSQVQEWARALTPIAWPVIIGAYVVLQGLNQ